MMRSTEWVRWHGRIFAITDEDSDLVHIETPDGLERHWVHQAKLSHFATTAVGVDTVRSRGLIAIVEERAPVLRED